ncbi:MAG: CysZ protein [Planctomycetota bacterium]|jgi:CysZ protein
MLRAFSLAVGQMFSGPILGVLGACTMLSIACFVGLWFGIDWAIETWLEGSDGFLAGLASGGGGFVAALVLAYFLFPVVATAFISLFLERIAKTVENQHYPHLPPAKGLPLLPSLAVTARFVILMIAANVLLLALLFFPPVYAVAWFVVNGWLIGREYLELVAMRRISVRGTDRLRKRHGTESLVTGVVLAVLLPIPIFNMVLPVFATCVMVHRFHEWRGSEFDSDLGDEFDDDLVS